MTQQANLMSPEARTFLDSLPPFEDRPLPPAPEDVQGWSAWQAHIETVATKRSEALLDTQKDKLEPIAWQMSHSLKVPRITPKTINQNMPPVLFLHGGGYVGFSAQSSLFATIPLALTLGTTVISVCYPLAPQSNFQSTVPLTAKAIANLLTENTVLVGDSAGGGLAVAAVQYLQGIKAKVPQKLVLWSPWVDLTANAGIDDPILRYDADLETCATAYAGTDTRNPIASPLYGPFSSNFPPTLIQAGTAEILYPSITALYTKLQGAGVESHLKTFDGMYHSFPVLTPEAPESKTAYEQISAFLNRDQSIIKRPNNDS